MFAQQLRRSAGNIFLIAAEHRENRRVRDGEEAKADHKTLVMPVRASVKKNRKPALQKKRSTGSDACDYDWSNPPPDDVGNPTEMYRAQAEHYRNEAIHLVEAYPIVGAVLILMKEPPAEAA